ncbi:MAG: Kynurenine 3-monooxygenase [Chlamydiae bacterium]|nr:Kynurenine 3-monooxygenase [Chlamydiota bacterium]
MSINTNPSVLIIGGGPAGLATAIEAHESGARVTLVEKRDASSRFQWLLLFDSSLDLLKKWKVEIPEMRNIDLGDNKKLGIVPINQLEECLRARVNKLGITILHGEFEGFEGNHPRINGIASSYDIIVGADGTKSTTREALGIPNVIKGKAKGLVAFMRQESSGQAEEIFPDPIQINHLFCRKITIPSAGIIFLQAEDSDELGKEQLLEIAEKSNWQQEAQALRNNRAKIFENIPVTLQQAECFSDEGKRAILVGDAAASASFLQGMGANIAFKTAEHAGRFFKNFQKDRHAAFQTFNQAMKATTDELIDDSQFLFNPSS